MQKKRMLPGKDTVRVVMSTTKMTRWSVTPSGQVANIYQDGEVEIQLERLQKTLEEGNGLRVWREKTEYITFQWRDERQRRDEGQSGEALLSCQLLKRLKNSNNLGLVE